MLIYAYARQSPTVVLETDSGVSDDSDDASQDGDVDAGDDSSDNDSVSSEVIRKKRKKFEKVQKRRLKLLRLKRGKTNLFKFDFRLDSFLSIRIRPLISFNLSFPWNHSIVKANLIFLSRF